jgi:hypothetical protein
MARTLEQVEAREAKKTRLTTILTHHIGRAKMIGMGELFTAVFGETYTDKINHTRALRDLIDDLQRIEAMPIVSVKAPTGGGYFLASAGSEMDAYCRGLRISALKKLQKEAQLRKTSLAALLGQIQLNLGIETSGPLSENEIDLAAV